LKSRVVVVPILRAGLGMVDAVLDVVPTARLGHLGLARDEQTAMAARYYGHLPEGLSGDVVLIVDPMLATGGSAKLAIDEVKRAGAMDVRLVCIIAAPEGVAAVQSAHPSLDIYAAVVDRELNAKKFILPGLGDFGDRLYGTA
jgi:uracil phosphoribosyltransferase